MQMSQMKSRENLIIVIFHFISNESFEPNDYIYTCEIKLNLNVPATVCWSLALFTKRSNYKLALSAVCGLYRGEK